MEDFLTGPGITLAYYVTIIGFFLILAFAVFHTVTNLIDNPSETIKGILGAIVFVVFLFVIYTMASGAMEGIFKASKFAHIDTGTMKMVSAGVTAAIALTLISFVFMILSLVYDLVK